MPKFGNPLERRNALSQLRATPWQNFAPIDTSSA
jgi:hypothetical protein